MLKLPWKTCIRAGLTVVAVYLACTYWHMLTHALGVALSAASPLIVGAVIAYVANILMSFYERNFFVKSKKPVFAKIRRPACMALAFLTAIVAIIWLLTTVLPELAKCLEMIIASLPGAISKAYAWLDEKIQLGTILKDLNLSLPGVDFDWKNAITSAVGFVMTGVGGAVGVAVTAVSSVFSTVVTLFLALVFAVYLLAGKEKLAAQIIRVSRTSSTSETTRMTA